MKNCLAYLLICIPTVIFGQISDFSEKFVLPDEVEETSGLIFLNNKIITHNDSGDDANLYEIDDTSGLITRPILVSNATHVDWEDITQDDTHIYIGDIGNNNGDRQDLTIYKIVKSDYLNNTSVTAEVITFSYEDQTDFTPQPNNTNFDAEAISLYDDQIFIFTKNWVDMETNVYTIPTDPGSYTATKVSSYDVNGLITGSNFNAYDQSFLLTGYDTVLNPFLIYIDENRPPGNDIFSGGAQKIFLTQELGPGNQVEGITHYNDANYYISREKFVTSAGGNQVIVIQKLFQFLNAGSTALSVDDNTNENLISLYPNPTTGIISIKNNDSKNIVRVEIYDIKGNKVFQSTSLVFDTTKLSKGLYIIRAIFADQKSSFQKIIKI